MEKYYKRRRKGTKILLTLGIILVLAAGGFYGYKVVYGMMAAGQAEKVMDRMTELVPQYEDGDAAATGRGEDPLPMVEIDGTSFVGYIEIPEQSIKVPVASADSDGSKFAFQDSGSPVKGRFKIGGRDQKGAFSTIDEIKPGERITFVDVNGIRYDYQVTGMGSVKEWEGVDHDLILYRGISRNIQFAVFAEMEK